MGPDLLLLDIGMPRGEMSGLAALIGLRESARWAKLPVIVLSELGNPFNVDIVAWLGVRIILMKGGVTAPEVARSIHEALSP